MTTTVENAMPALSFTGIYGLPEAARYLNVADSARKAYPPVSSSGVIRWTRRWLEKPASDGVRGADLTLTFTDLISMRVIAALRGARVGWKDIKDFERRLRETAGVKKPFASEFLWTGRALDDRKSRLAPNGRNGQTAFDALRRNLIPAHGLTFLEESGVAETWTPARGIWLHPEIQFGAPCIEGTRIPTIAIYSMVKAGDSPEFAARSYRISSESVEAAIEWERKLEAV